MRQRTSSGEFGRARARAEPSLRSKRMCDAAEIEAFPRAVMSIVQEPIARTAVKCNKSCNAWLRHNARAGGER